LPECLPRRKLLNATYFKIAVPTGLFVGAANLMQKIGLQYTTPTQYAFLENLSCVVVPLLLILYVKKRPHPLTVGASLLCLFGCFVLSGLISSGGAAFGVGEILCALAGVFYGVNIATTGVFATRLNAVLYVTIQMWVNVAVSGVAMVVLNAIRVNGAPLEAISFSW
ncbi:MAG: EamA family transporter, partial [Clostridia bacterium]|nr:EamA family transporter [Clostridia bacterium]